MKLVKLTYCITILIAAITAMTSQTFGQTITSQNDADYFSLNVEAGLPSNEVYDVIQDKFGYLWFATDNGVIKYDGAKLEYYNMDLGLTDNVVFNLYEDDKGNVWCGTFNNQICYIQPDGKIEEYKYNNKLREYLTEVTPNHLVILKMYYVNDELVIGFRYGGGIHIDKNGVLTKSKLTNGYNAEVHHGLPYIFSLSYSYRDSNVRIFGETFKSDQLEKQFDVVGQVARSSDCCMIGERGYAATWSNLTFVRLHGRSKSVITKVDGEIIKILYFDDILWICTLNHGVYGMRVNGDGSLTQLYHLFKQKTITSVCKDNNNGHWFTSLNEGIHYLPTIDFWSYRIKPEEANLKFAKYINGELFITDLNGKIRVLSDRMENIREIEGITAITNFVDFEPDPQSQSFALFGHKPKTYAYIDKQFKHVPGLYYLQDNIMYYIKGQYFRNKSKIQVKLDGFSITDENGRETFNHPFDRGSMSCVFNNGILGINFFRGGEFYHVRNGMATKVGEHPPGERIKRMKSYGDFIYFATRSGSIYRFSLQNDLELVYTLPENIIVNDFEVQGEILWIASNQGLFKTNVRSRNIRRYWNKAVKYVFIDRDLVILSTLHEVISFKDYTQVNNSTVSLNNFFVNGVSSSRKELAHTENNIALSFNAVGAPPKKRVAFECVLIGQDTTITVITEGRVQYPQLSPGEYTFYIINRDNRNESEKIEFYIAPPWWQRTWVIILVSFIVFLITIGIFRRVARRRERKLKLEKQLIELKSKALRAQMNPHFIFNVMNVVQSLISSKDFENSSKAVVKLSRLIRNTLNYSKKDLVNLKEEIDFTKNYFDLENLRMNHEMSFGVHVDEEVILEDVNVPPICIQPLIENAIVHGIVPSDQLGVIKMVIQRNHEFDGDYVEIIIRDNGIGFSTLSKKAGSEGLGLIIDRLRILNKKNQLILPKETGNNSNWTEVKILLAQ